MEESVFDAVRTAITITRNERITSTLALRCRLLQRGFDRDVVSKALRTIADRLAVTQPLQQGGANQ